MDYFNTRKCPLDIPLCVNNYSVDMSCFTEAAFPAYEQEFDSIIEGTAQNVSSQFMQQLLCMTPNRFCNETSQFFD